MDKPLNLFISYSKTDRAYLDIAKKHLKIFERQGQVRVWDDTFLIPGELWDIAIKRELAVADIILFLVSADLISTDYIWDVEMKQALIRAEAKELAIVPVIIRPCRWESAPFGAFTALPEKARAISTWDDQDEAWRQVVERIEILCR